MSIHHPQLCHLLILLKWPKPGQVKTRLAATIGDEAACALYRRMVADTVRLAQSLPAQDWRVTILSDGADAATFQSWLGDSLSVRPQAAGDLGDRLRVAFADAASTKPASVMAIGGDCPDLTAAHLLQAQRVLTQRDVVLGPAADGGYYLIGSRSHTTAGLFSAIDWSTPRVLLQTLECCRRQRYTVEQLATLRDVDTAADARACGLLKNLADAG